MITSLQQLDLDKTYTYSDYLSWRLQEYVELLKGKIFKMAAPSIKHQRVSSRLHTLIGHHLWKKPCEIFHAPIDVRLITMNVNQQPIETVVQPDLCVVCDPSMLDKKVCNGAPNLIIEILSPGNTKKEMKPKHAIYEEAGVQEYWLVHPLDNTILQYVLHSDGKYHAFRILTDDDVITTPILAGLVIQLADIFED